MRESTDNRTSEPEVVVEATTKPERKKKDRDTHLDASNPKGTMLFFSFLPSFLLLLLLPQLLLRRQIKKTTAAISG
jgi:hypothetical protein